MADILLRRMVIISTSFPFSMRLRLEGDPILTSALFKRVDIIPSNLLAVTSPHLLAATSSHLLAATPVSQNCDRRHTYFCRDPFVRTLLSPRSRTAYFSSLLDILHTRLVSLALSLPRIARSPFLLPDLLCGSYLDGLCQCSHLTITIP
jgi:hypothetical protein